MSKIKVIIPAYNEEKLLHTLLKKFQIQLMIIIINNSTDNTIKVATAAGATVLSENRKGYGYACLKGMEYISTRNKTRYIVFFRWRLF
jgi:glycosyltransferase involved in cell wall biosynthesis